MEQQLPAALALVLLALAAHPFVTYPLSLLALRRLRPPPPCAEPDSAERRVPVSICLCAYNEEASIAATAENLLAIKRAAPDTTEVLVYVDAATDATAAILRNYEPEITVVVGTVRGGKTRGMRRLVSMAGGDILVFTDATVLFDADAVDSLCRRFADPAVGCVCGRLVYTGAEVSATAEVGSAYWRLEEAVKRLEDGTGSVLCADGSIFAVRRSLYPEVPDDIIDDFYVSLSILCDGHRIVRAEDAVARERSTTERGDEFRRKIRIACQAFNVHRLLWPRVRRRGVLTVYKYVSHKLLRWFAAPLLALGALSALVWVGLAFGWMVAAALGLGGAVMLTVGALMTTGPAARIVEILSAFLATALGVLRSLRGERFQVWTPAGSVRAGPTAAPAVRPIHGSRIKRTIDVAGALTLLVLLAPLMLALALLIRLDGGPSVYFHRRIGAGGRPFDCMKFRTMQVDADRQLAELLERDPKAREEWQRSFKLKNDPRVTPIGAFLRRSSLDELPQLINVLKGEMSLVGPRPIVEKEVAFYDRHYPVYIQCRPGITGLWQISGRSDVDYGRRVELDCAYVASWTVLQDVVILLRTPATVLRRRGAY